MIMMMDPVSEVYGAEEVRITLIKNLITPLICQVEEYLYLFAMLFRTEEHFINRSKTPNWTSGSP